MTSAIFDPSRWQDVEGFDFRDLTYHRATDHGTVRIAFDRPEVRNAFRRHMGAHAAQWDWAAAHVPSALNDEAEAERLAEKSRRPR